jgi:TctA family transporter
MNMDGGGYRRALRWTNLILLLIGIVLAILFGPF